MFRTIPMIRPVLAIRPMLVRTISSVRSIALHQKNWSNLTRPRTTTTTYLTYPRTYSTKTAPPPPPPPPPQDKNAKGKVLLTRITNAFTFSLSSILVVGAFGVAVIVVGLILSELFLPSGETRTFNKAVKLIEKHEGVKKALAVEPGERLKAYGEVPGGKWVRNRPVQSVRSIGKDGKERLIMKFHVESKAGKHGSIMLEQIDTSFWSSEFAYIALDMPRARRVYVIEPKLQPKKAGEKGFLGLKWGPKRD